MHYDEVAHRLFVVMQKPSNSWRLMQILEKRLRTFPSQIMSMIWLTTPHTIVFTLPAEEEKALLA